MYHGLHLAASDLLSAPTLGERGDGADRLRVGLLLQDRLEVAVQPAELGGKLLLREGAARSDAFGRLVPQVRQQELEQLRGLPRRDVPYRRAQVSSAPRRWDRSARAASARSDQGIDAPPARGSPRSAARETGCPAPRCRRRGRARARRARTRRAATRGHGKTGAPPGASSAW